MPWTPSRVDVLHAQRHRGTTRARRGTASASTVPAMRMIASCVCLPHARRRAAKSMTNTTMNASEHAAIGWNGGNCVRNACRISAHGPAGGDEAVRPHVLGGEERRQLEASPAAGRASAARSSPIPPTPRSTVNCRASTSRVQPSAAWSSQRARTARRASSGRTSGGCGGRLPCSWRQTVPREGANLGKHQSI